MTRLHIHVNTRTFRRIKSGEETYITKPASSHWTRVIEERENKEIVIYDDFKPGPAYQLRFPWRGFDKVGEDGMQMIRVKLEK
jgi:hypothetical protein